MQYPMTERKLCSEECTQKTCRLCVHVFEVDPSDRSVFDNYRYGCFVDGEGHPARQKACEQFKCCLIDPDGTCRPVIDLDAVIP
jgi:hypothetical protein